MSDDACLVLRPFAAADDALLARWLRDPEVISWWGNAASATAETRLARDCSAALCRIIALDGVPIGYAQAMDIAAIGGEAAPPGIPPGAWDCDLFIGSTAHRGRGLGRGALDLLVAEVFATTLAVACALVVSIRREQAARAYEQAGFRWVRIWSDPVIGPSWVMLHERPRR